MFHFMKNITINNDLNCFIMFHCVCLLHCLLTRPNYTLKVNVNASVGSVLSLHLGACI